jgi:hypothetical protein
MISALSRPPFAVSPPSAEGKLAIFPKDLEATNSVCTELRGSLHSRVPSTRAKNR